MEHATTMLEVLKKYDANGKGVVTRKATGADKETGEVYTFGMNVYTKGVVASKKTALVAELQALLVSKENLPFSLADNSPVYIADSSLFEGEVNFLVKRSLFVPVGNLTVCDF